MKKIIISLIALVALSTAAHAQYNNALGIRFGAGTAFGAELSYQGYVSNINRVELDLGASFGKHYNAISMAAIAPSAPLFPAFVPARSTACSMFSVVTTATITGMPVASPACATPLETSLQT